MSDDVKNPSAAEAQELVDQFADLMVPCEDKEHLHAWIEFYLGLDFPDQIVSRFSNSSPMDFIWEAYDAIINGKPLAMMGLAGRESLKTLGLSVIDLLAFLHDKRDAAHIAMTRQQGMRARAYLEQFINKIPPVRDAISKQNNSELKLKIDNQDVGIEILPATPKAVQGAHVAFLSFDELASSMEPNNVKAVRDAHGIVGTSREGKPGVTVKITSRQSGHSLAEQEIRNVKETGLQIRRWTTLDATERCPDERSGTKPLPLWVNIIKGEKYTEDEFRQIPDARRDGFELTTDTREKCFTCPLAVYCQGDLKKVNSKSKLLRKIDDVINKIRLSSSHEWALAQIMSLKPSTQGLIYFEFQRDVHMKDWTEMWEILTREKAPGPITKEMWVAKAKAAGVRFYAGVDFGWTHPTTCVVVGVDKRDNVYVVEAIGRVQMKDADFAELLKQTVFPAYEIEMFCPDSEDPAGIQDFRDADLPVTQIDKTAGSVKRGINKVKGLLRVPGTNRDAKIFFSKDLDVKDPAYDTNIIDELEMYHKKMDVAGTVKDDDDPEKEFDDFLDALRYVIYWLFAGTGKAVWAGGLANSGTGSVLEQAVQQHNLTYVDNRDILDAEGRVKSPKKDDDPEGGSTPPAGGGMTWSWT
jgi:hypothetical protein